MIFDHNRFYKIVGHSSVARQLAKDCMKFRELQNIGCSDIVILFCQYESSKQIFGMRNTCSPAMVFYTFREEL